MLYLGYSLIDAGGNSVVQISAIDDIGKIPGFLTLKGPFSAKHVVRGSVRRHLV